MTDLPSLNLKLDDPPPNPPPDSKRGGKGRPKGSKNKPKGLSDVELRKALEQALVFPAVPSMIFYPTAEGKAYLASHFTMTAPWGAEQLIMAAKLSPPLRAQLERIARGGVAGILLSFASIWLGGPVLFMLGQQRLAEGLTASTQIDESTMGQAMEGMFGDMMGGVVPEPPAPADGGNMGSQNGESSQPESQPFAAESPAVEGSPFAPDWAVPQPEPGTPE